MSETTAHTARESVGHDELPKKLRWWDAFAMSMAMPAALFLTVGGSIAALGGWTAGALWGFTMLIALLANWLYIELATMFPKSSGGVAGFVAEAWKKRAPWVAPIAGIGYWLPWAVGPATFGLVAGMLIEAQWISTPGWEANFGPIHLNVPIVVTLIIIAILYVVNMLGVRVTMGFVYVTAALLMVPLFVCIVVAFASGRWNPANLTWGLHGFEGVYIALVWIYIMAWTRHSASTSARSSPRNIEIPSRTRRAPSSQQRCSA